MNSYGDVADAVCIAGLTVRRGERTVIKEMDLRVPRGSILGLLGPSGSGKTTVMRAIMGVQSNVSGEVTVAGFPAGNPETRGKVGYVTQSPSIYHDLTVRQNISYFARIALPQASRSELKSATDQALLHVGLADRPDDRVGALSGGQRSRVSLACALVGDPQILVLDEPTVGLDPLLREQLWTIFRALAAEGRTLLVSSHVMDEAARCDHLILLREGSVAFSGSPSELLGRTGESTYDRAFLTLITEEAR